MTFDILFEQRILVAEKLKECLRKSGFTKVSFSKKTGISRPTLDRLLNGTIDSKSTFDKHLQKILFILDMKAEDLLFYHKSKSNQEVEVVYSSNEPVNYVMNETAQRQYQLLLDVLDLCTIYY